MQCCMVRGGAEESRAAWTETGASCRVDATCQASSPRSSSPAAGQCHQQSSCQKELITSPRHRHAALLQVSCHAAGAAGHCSYARAVSQTTSTVAVSSTSRTRSATAHGLSPLIQHHRHQQLHPIATAVAASAARAAPAHLLVPVAARERVASATLGRHHVRRSPSTFATAPKHPPCPDCRDPRLLLLHFHVEAGLQPCLQLLPC